MWMDGWRSRSVAFTAHLGISMVVAVFSALLVFGVWYPYPYDEISGGRSLFMMMIVVDVILGPLITFLIYSPAKKRAYLILDFTIIGSLQVAALLYGIWTMFAARPVHLVFEYNRMAVVHAADIDPADLAAAPTGLQALPIGGPTQLSLRPLAPSEAVESVMQAAAGVPQAAQPRLWQAYSDACLDIRHYSRPVMELAERFPEHAAVVEGVIAGTNMAQLRLRYLPMLARGKGWTVLIDGETCKPVGFVPLDSFL